MSASSGPSRVALCPIRRPEDGARCAVNAHPEQPNAHAYIVPLDPRMRLLDSLAETFRKNEEWPAYHHVRAVAHDLGFHLSACSGGIGVHGRRLSEQSANACEESAGA